MCYHYSLKALGKELQERFDARLKDEAKVEPVYHKNGFQHRAMPVITADEPKTIQL